jgi:glycosyltransferase involved in cell wall biosynthesis
MGSEKKRAVIASGMAPTYVGGLGAYQRFLARALGEYFGIDGTFLAIKSENPVLQKSDETLPWSVETLAVRGSWPGAQKLLNSMASRPLLHPFLERLVFWLVPPRSLERIDGSVNWIHFVGTGWDFFGFALLRWARRRGIRFTIWPAVHPRSWGDDAIDVRLYTGADGVFCQSNYEKRHLASLGVPERILIQCGLPPMCRMDGDRERFRADHGLTEDMPSVLFLGRRDGGKGYPALLEAWRLVLEKCPQAVVLLAGPGGSEFKNLVEALPPASLRDLGVPDELGKADALAGCDVFCLPSAHESFGIAYVEAWSYGRAVICGTAPACRELIEDGVTGVWADQEPATLADRILLLLQQPDRRARIGREGRARQQRDLTPERVANIHLKGFHY